jgi:peptidoglycan/LPS O-acetylase OafA/YrhL
MALGSGPDERGGLNLDWTPRSRPVTTSVSRAAPDDPAGAAPAGPRRFRGDIDGLRAVAIVLVVGYHALIPGFHGGFIGVDVFFVISGFLITRNLLSESTRTGRVALMTFWAKRIRRLVPALALMVVVVVALALIVLPSLDWPSVADQARAALLYVSNLVFARQATDYFGGDISTSLFLHTWSLGVEEQFYLLWPLLVGGACLLVRGRERRLLRPVLIVGFGVTFVVSLSLCVHLTSTGSAFAFFGLPSRA